MFVSLEAELPAYYLNGSGAVLPQDFQRVWDSFSHNGWIRDDFGVHKNLDNPHGFLKSGHSISTDAGPIFEIVVQPDTTIQTIDAQLLELRNLSLNHLNELGIGLLGSGVHPLLATIDQDNYLRYRTPRRAYDYAIEKRGWAHHTMINIAATQEIIDVDIEQAVDVVRVMHCLTGLLIFLFRNDPDYSGKTQLLSVRPQAWYNHVPTEGQFAEDRHKVWLPEKPMMDWNDYLYLLWQTSPMFVLGTKNNGAVYIPQHPHFWEFLFEAPSQGWQAARMVDDQKRTITPEWSHLNQSDWPYMGLARLRWQWLEREDTQLDELAKAVERGNGHVVGFLKENLRKVVIENRSVAAAPPGEELVSLALIVGIMQNFASVQRYVEVMPYDFWVKLARAAEIQPLDSRFDGHSVINMLKTLLELSRTGLLQRGLNEDVYLDVLDKRLRDKLSPSERMLQIFHREGIDGVIRKLTY
ncbi:hypothetical protein KKG46_03355 [Patescibacteria group bacterium]|nr:hypothetical protein [Patescibacteria group bacterium]